MRLKKNIKNKLIVVVVLLALIAIALGILFTSGDKKEPEEPAVQPETVEPVIQPEETVEQPEQQEVQPETATPAEEITVDLYSDDSINRYVSMDNRISENYVPSDLRDVNVKVASAQQLREEAAQQLEAMFQAARADRIYLKLVSGYRSYSYQKDLYNYYISIRGKSFADSVDAYPGASEHQLGLAADIGLWSGACELEYCFVNYLDYPWLQENAHLYGWIERYPKGKESITGNSYAPWHFRYVGVEEATKIHDSGLTFEEYYRLK